MTSLTTNQSKALLILFKDYTSYFNANSLSQLLGLSRFGAQKMLKRLESEGLLSSQAIGKAMIYTPVFDVYAQKLYPFLLASEARQHLRWQAEFESLYGRASIVIFFGSASRNYGKARDIDLLVVAPVSSRKELQRLISKKQVILPKKLHAILMNREELVSNLRDGNKAALDIVRTGIVLHGQDELYEVIKDVTSR